MRYCWIRTVFHLFCVVVPQVLWCYFIHCWTHWTTEHRKFQKTSWRYWCKKCGRYWHDEDPYGYYPY